MQSDDDFETVPPYDPDDWGAPLPADPPKVPSVGEASSIAASGSADPQAKDADSAPRDLRASPASVDAETVEAVPASDEPSQPQQTGRGKRRRSPARAIAGGPGIVLPHAAKADLFPAIFSRSALFRVSGADDSAIAPDASDPGIVIAAQGGVNLRIKGPWPRMRDKAVWEVALEMAKASPDASAPIPVSLSKFADRLGYADKGSDTLAWIWTSLRRLSLCQVEFDSPSPSGQPLVGNLLAAARETTFGKEIAIDPAFASRLLDEDFQFVIDRARRATLSTALARWLHDFLSTHSGPRRPLDVPYLRALCGYAGKNKRFPNELERALVELAQKAPGILSSHSFSKPTRSSDGWTVSLVYGQEKRRFEQPKPASKPAAPKPGRSGVAL